MYQEYNQDQYLENVRLWGVNNQKKGNPSFLMDIDGGISNALNDILNSNDERLEYEWDLDVADQYSFVNSKFTVNTDRKFVLEMLLMMYKDTEQFDQVCRSIILKLVAGFNHGYYEDYTEEDYQETRREH